MNEFDPTNREHINMSPLKRFEADIDTVDSYADLYISLSRYMADEFNIPDYQVSLILLADEEKIPSVELFEQNPVLAREQARLVLVKIALSLAEFVIDDIDKFSTWTNAVAQAAMNIDKSDHTITECMRPSRGSESHSCAHSQECPIKFTAYQLIADAGKAYRDELEYSEAFVDMKIARTVAKIHIANELGLFDDETTQMMIRSYNARCYLRGRDPNN